MPGFRVQGFVGLLQSTLNVLSGNLHDIEAWSKLFDDPAVALPVFDLKQRAAGDAAIARSTRLLNNFLASAQTFINVTRGGIKRDAREDARFRSLLPTVDDFTKTPIARTVTALRNCALHRETVHAHVVLRSLADASGLETTFCLSDEQLDRLPDLHGSRATLASFGKPPNIPAMAAAFVDEAEAMCQELTSHLNDTFGADLQDLARAKTEAARHLGIAPQAPPSPAHGRRGPGG
jgi:hypothetical protein